MASKRRNATGIQLRLDGDFEWTEIRSGLFQVRDSNGIIRAHVTRPDNENQWWRALLEADVAPYDAPTFDAIKKLVEGLIREQDQGPRAIII